MIAASLPQQQIGCQSLVVLSYMLALGRCTGSVHFPEASPTLQAGKDNTDSACLAFWMHSAAQPRAQQNSQACSCAFHSWMFALCFYCLDVDYSDEHCHLVSWIITLLSGRFHTELYLDLCYLSNLFMTDFTRLGSKQRCEGSRSQRKAKIQSERNVSHKTSVNQGKL